MEPVNFDLADQGNDSIIRGILDKDGKYLEYLNIKNFKKKSFFPQKLKN